MRRCLNLNFLTLAFSVCGYLFAGNAQETKPKAGEQQVIKHAGECISPNGTCKAVLNTSSLGGFLVLTLKKEAYEVELSSGSFQSSVPFRERQCV